jgi:putative membrane protein
MKEQIIRILFNMIVLMLCGIFFKFVHLNSWESALVVVIVLSLLNMLIKPVLILLTIPVTVFTFGLFILVINALILLLTDYLVDDFSLSGFWGAFKLGLIISISNSILDKIIYETAQE